MSTTPNPRRPTSPKRLNQLIERQAAKQPAGKAKVFRKSFIAAVVTQLLPDSAYLKGGTSLSLRYPLSEARFSRDIDSAFTDSQEQFEQSFRQRLSDGWEGFTGTMEREHRATLPLGVGLDPLIIHLDYNGLRFATVSFEASPDLEGHGPDAEHAMDEGTLDTFRSMGFPMNPPRMMDVNAQLADKLNGLSNPRNHRGKDLRDIATILRHEEPDLELLRRHTRTTERRMDGHDTHMLDDDTRHDYYASYLEAGGDDFENDWDLANQLLMEVDLNYASMWHKKWSPDGYGEAIPGATASAEYERRETERIRRQQHPEQCADAAKAAIPKQAETGDVTVRTYMRADGTVVQGYRRGRPRT